jgi:hypothetical protein
MGSFLSDTLFKSFSSKYVYSKIFMIQLLHNIQNVQKGKRHQKKTVIKFSSFQICVVTNLSAPLLCLFSFCFWGEVSNS